ncbi:MAG TPA: hypothetical protein VJV04_16490 [Nitrospiraceae bacterium]|nr:hypothetical protein [Nitrospiraceae bacterium]
MHKCSEWMATIGFLGLMLAYDPTQSTGPGTQQGDNADMSTQRGASGDSKSAKNEDSGSATGAVRDRSQSGIESGDSHGSARPDSSGRTMKESGSGTTSGAAKSRK